MRQVIEEGSSRMDGALSSLQSHYAKLRTGRASTALVEDIKVDYYGSATPLNQIASISVPDARSITIQPWDKNAFGDVDKAIQRSDLGLNPVNDGKLIRINIPPLTEERRKELVKLAKKYAEDAKVAVRNVRRDLNETLKKMQKNKEITEDDLHKGLDEVQELTDEYVNTIEESLAEKEKEILEI